MDRVDLEALVIHLVDQVQFRGYAVKHDVEDPALLREFIKAEARGRCLRVRTGIAKSDARTVWACRPDDVIKFLRPSAEEVEARVIEAMERSLGRGNDENPS